METIVLKNKTYYLVPEEDWGEIQDMVMEYLAIHPDKPSPQKEVVNTIDVRGDNEVKVAEPKVFGYRERFKKRELTVDDVRFSKKSAPIRQVADSDVAGYRDSNGESLFFGEGVQEDIL